MRVELPVAALVDGKKIGSVTIKRPKGSVIAETHKRVEDGDPYAAMATFAAGSMEELGTDQLPFISVEEIVVRVIMMMGVSEAIEGIYSCPLCHRQLQCVGEEADKISDLPVNILRGDDGEPDNVPIDIAFEYPVEIKNARSGETLDRVSSLTLRFPTIRDCSTAAKKVGIRDTVRLQNAITVEAIEKVNGTPADKTWKATWGAWVLDQADLADLRKIGQEYSRWGRQRYVQKRCPSCGKQWKAEVDIQGFFASGLGNGD